MAPRAIDVMSCQCMPGSSPCGSELDGLYRIAIKTLASSFEIHASARAAAITGARNRKQYVSPILEYVNREH
jgi:hypothetical protein